MDFSNISSVISELLVAVVSGGGSGLLATVVKKSQQLTDVEKRARELADLATTAAQTLHDVNVRLATIETRVSLLEVRTAALEILDAKESGAAPHKEKEAAGLSAQIAELRTRLEKFVTREELGTELKQQEEVSATLARIERHLDGGTRCSNPALCPKAKE
jgi:DNA repair ATPase RecN